MCGRSVPWRGRGGVFVVGAAGPSSLEAVGARRGYPCGGRVGGVRAAGWRRAGWDGRPALVVASAVGPPGPISNPVVKHRSAGEYWRGDPPGGEAAAGAGRRPWRPAAVRPPAHPRPDPPPSLPRGGAVAARWAHNPKVGGSNPPPATPTPLGPPPRGNRQLRR